uniref:Integrase catalytic domain-containing protein n=1 Tax=Amphimedon queenslandica TaxID=400682 RepID=A0A1X7TRP6_AMPQE
MLIKLKQITQDSGAQMFVANPQIADIEKNHEWMINSGASKHMTIDRDMLRYYQKFETPEPVWLGQGCTFDKFKEFKAIAEKEKGQKIKAIRGDRGGKFMSEEFRSYLAEDGIKHKYTAAYSPQQNGVTERLNRILGENARSMIIHAGLSNAHGQECIDPFRREVAACEYH